MRNVRVVLAVLLALCGVALAVATPATAYPAGQVGTAQINATTFAPGATVTVTVQNTTPGPLTMQIFSAPVTIGTGTVGPLAEGSVSGVIPAGYSGPHTIQVTGAGGEIYPFSITVTGAPSGGFSLSCLAATGKAGAAAGDSGPVLLGFNGNGFAAGDTYALIANTESIATGTASTTGFLSLDGGLDIAPDTDIALSVTTSAGVVVASTVFADAQPCFIRTTPTPTIPPTVPPTSTGAPSPVGSGTTVTVGVTLPAGQGSGKGGALASTGAQVGLGAGFGLAALLAGGLLLLASRRRTARH